MNKLTVAALAVALIAITLVSWGSLTHATTTNISIPDYSMCLHQGTFQVTVSASSLSSVNAWQINFTWAHGNLNLTSFTYGNPWNSGTSASKINRNGVGGLDNALIGYSFNNGATYSSTSQTTMFVATFRILRWPSGSTFHITTSSDTAKHALITMPLNSDLSEQAYATTDGSWSNCLLRPSP